MPPTVTRPVEHTGRRLGPPDPLDWWLPGQDGLQVLERHRREGKKYPYSLSPRSRRGQRPGTRLDGGADDYLCKPFAFEELLARAAP